MDFDSRGRLYIVYASGRNDATISTGRTALLLIILPLSVPAVDQQDRYFTDGGTIFRRNLDDSLPASLPDTVNTGLYLSSIHGLCRGPDLACWYRDAQRDIRQWHIPADASASVGSDHLFTDSEYMNGMVHYVESIYLYVPNPYPSYEPYDKSLCSSLKVRVQLTRKHLPLNQKWLVCQCRHFAHHYGMTA